MWKICVLGKKHFFDVPAPNLHEETGMRIWMKMTTRFHVFIVTVLDMVGARCSLSLLLHINFRPSLLILFIEFLHRPFNQFLNSNSFQQNFGCQAVRFACQFRFSGSGQQIYNEERFHDLNLIV